MKLSEKHLESIDITKVLDDTTLLVGHIRDFNNIISDKIQCLKDIKLQNELYALCYGIEKSQEEVSNQLNTLLE